MASRPIDEKIVVMKLDNSDFKQKAAETTGLFGKITAGLNKIPGVNLGKTAEELNGINTAARGVNMAGVGTAVETVSAKFSAMSVIAITALSNVVNRAVDAGMRIGKSLSLDQVNAGFQEYELKMGSIQTILANTSRHGTTLEDVSKNLGELNAYADKTIYNFGDMTKNIGLFTNAGLKLEESTSMIKGFSNAAAASGTNSENASRAAYQLSQGLSSGYLMTMDWMSLTNAGMGNDNMKRDLIALGQEMGTLGRSTEDTMKNWKEALSDDKWLTSEVMSTYLQAMAGDMDAASLKAIGLSDEQTKILLNNARIGEESATFVRTYTQLMDTLQEAVGSGWSESFEHIFGDFDEATKLWTKVSDTVGGMIDKSSKARNRVIKEVADGGGFLNIFDGIANASKPVLQIFSAMKTAFKMVFPPASAATIIKVTEAFKEFTKGLTLSPDSVTRLTNIFRGLFSIFSTAWEIVKRLTAALVGLIPGGVGGGVLDIIEKLANMATEFNRSVKEGNGLTKFLDNLVVAFSKVGDFLGTVGSKVIDFASSLRENLGIAIDWVIEKLAPVGAYLKEAFGGSYGDELVGVGTIAAIIAVVKKVTSFFDGDQFDIFGSLQDMVDGISETFSGIGEAVNNFATSVKYINLILIATAIGILAVSLKLIEGIDAEDLAKGITALATALGIMIAGMLVMSKFNVSGGIRASVTLIALAAAVNLMAIALKQISDLSIRELIKGVGGLFAIVTALSIGLIAISKFGGRVKVGSLQLIALSGAILILVQAIKQMSAIDTGDLFTSIGALALIFGSLAVFLKIVDRTKFGMSSAVGLVLVAAAITIIVTAIEDIAKINSTNMIKGLGSITAILAALALFSRVASGPQMILAGAGMLVIAEALKRLVEPISAFADMSWKELAKGMAGLAASLLILAGGIALFTLAAGGPMAILAATGMLLMAKSLQMMIDPILSFSGMSWEELAKGMAGMAASLVILAGAAFLMTFGMAGSLGVIAMAYALTLMIDPIERFSKMSWAELGKGFAAVAIGLTLLAVAAVLLTPAILPMLGMSAALLAMGVAMLAAGLGMSLFGTGLITLAGLTAGAVAGIISALSLLIQGLSSLIIDVVEFVVKLTVAILDGLNAILPKLIEVGWNIITKLLEGLEANLPNLIEKAGSLMVQFLNGMEEHIPEIVDAAANLMETLAVSVEENAPRFLNAWLTIMTEVAVIMTKAGAGVIDALFGWIPGVGEITSKIGETAELNIREAFDAQRIAEDKGSEFTDGLAAKAGDAAIAGNTLGASGADGILANNLSPVGGVLGTDFLSGLLDTSGSANTAGKTVGSSTLAGVATTNLTPIGGILGSDFAKSLSGTKGAAETAGKTIGANGKAGADSTNIAPVGTALGKEFSSALQNTTGNASTAGRTIGNAGKTAADSISLTSAGSGAGAEFASALQNKAGSTSTAGRTIANSGKSGAAQISMSSTGSNFGLGFAGGISASSVMAKVAAAGYSIAKRAKNAVSGWLDIRSPSRLMFKDGGFFGEGFALGIADKVKRVGGVAKTLAVTAKDSVNRFIDGFELPDQDNELHFKAIIDYDTLDTRKFGGLNAVPIRPDIRMTNALISDATRERRNSRINPVVESTKPVAKTEEAPAKQPYILQVVTPEKREIASWLVDDISDIQSFNLARDDKF